MYEPPERKPEGRCTLAVVVVVSLRTLDDDVEWTRTLGMAVVDTTTSLLVVRRIDFPSFHRVADSTPYCRTLGDSDGTIDDTVVVAADYSSAAVGESRCLP